MTKLRDLTWRERPRVSQLASALYPHLADAETKRQMLDRAAQDGRPQNMQRLGDRMGGAEEPVVEGGRFGGLIRKPVEVKPKSKKSWWE